MSSYINSFVLLYLSGAERVILVVHGFVKSTVFTVLEICWNTG